MGRPPSMTRHRHEIVRRIASRLRSSAARNAFWEGYRAAQRGDSWGSNPYLDGRKHVRRKAWNAGYSHGAELEGWTP